LIIVLIFIYLYLIQNNMKLEDRLRSANQEKWIDSIFDLMIRYENIYFYIIVYDIMIF
jgi:hypothetical protein